MLWHVVPVKLHSESLWGTEKLSNCRSFLSGLRAGEWFEGREKKKAGFVPLSPQAPPAKEVAYISQGYQSWELQKGLRRLSDLSNFLYSSPKCRKGARNHKVDLCLFPSPFRLTGSRTISATKVKPAHGAIESPRPAYHTCQCTGRPQNIRTSDLSSSWEHTTGELPQIKPNSASTHRLPCLHTQALWIKVSSVQA